MRGKDPYKHNRRHEPDFNPQRCVLRAIRKELLEDFVIGAINAVLFTGNTADWIVAELTSRAKNRKVESKDADAYKKELEKIRKQKERLLDLYLSGMIEKGAYSSKARDIEAREDFLDKEIKRLIAAIPAALDAEKIKKALSVFLESANADSPEYKKRLLSTYVEGIAVSNEKIVIYFKFPIPGNGDKIEKDTQDLFVRKQTSVSTWNDSISLMSGMYFSFFPFSGTGQ